MSTPCKYCGKLFLNVQEHITKTHHHNTITYQTLAATKYYPEHKVVDRFCYDGMTFIGLEAMDVFGLSKLGWALRPASDCAPGSPEEAFSKKHKVPKTGMTIIYVEHGDGVVTSVHTHNSKSDKTKALYTHNVHRP